MGTRGREFRRGPLLVSGVVDFTSGKECRLLSGVIIAGLERWVVPMLLAFSLAAAAMQAPPLWPVWRLHASTLLPLVAHRADCTCLDVIQIAALLDLSTGISHK